TGAGRGAGPAAAAARPAVRGDGGHQRGVDAAPAEPCRAALPAARGAPGSAAARPPPPLRRGVARAARAREQRRLRGAPRAAPLRTAEPALPPALRDAAPARSARGPADPRLRRRTRRDHGGGRLRAGRPGDRARLHAGARPPAGGPLARLSLLQLRAARLQLLG